MAAYKIVKGSNFDDENFNEEFVTGIPPMNQHQANIICAAINAVTVMQAGKMHTNYYKVVESNYELQVREA